MKKAPKTGEWLWDEENKKWIPLVKTETGHPDIEASKEKAVDNGII